MNRFFVRRSDVSNDLVRVGDPDDVLHLVRVLRVRPGDRIVAVVGGEELLVQVERLEPDAVLGRVLERSSPPREPALRVVLVQSLPKGEKMDLVVQKATELGAGEIVPAQAERCVVALDQRRAGTRQARWQRIAREAAQQSGRLAIPLVREVVSLRAALEAAAAGGGMLLFLWEQEQGLGLKEALQAPAEPPGEVCLFVGPEGGFSAGEAELARRVGARWVSLGPRILRTETAGPAALAMVLYELGDLGQPPRRTGR